MTRLACSVEFTGLKISSWLPERKLLVFQLISQSRAKSWVQGLAVGPSRLLVPAAGCSLDPTTERALRAVLVATGADFDAEDSHVGLLASCLMLALCWPCVGLTLAFWECLLGVYIVSWVRSWLGCSESIHKILMLDGTGFPCRGDPLEIT